jgi:hypothetical protein
MAPNKHLLKNYLLVWGVIFGATLLIYQMQTPRNPVVHKGLARVEPFKNAPKVEDSTEKMNELDPAEATLNKPREPYSLLKDVLPIATKLVSPTSQRCYEADFQPRLEKTGNFRQLTNNYKRGAPDSCSAPLHETVLSFYKVEPLA